jgi:hypothetical protein
MAGTLATRSFWVPKRQNGERMMSRLTEEARAALPDEDFARLGEG